MAKKVSKIKSFLLEEEDEVKKVEEAEEKDEKDSVKEEDEKEDKKEVSEESDSEDKEEVKEESEEDKEEVKEEDEKDDEVKEGVEGAVPQTGGPDYAKSKGSLSPKSMYSEEDDKEEKKEVTEEDDEDWDIKFDEEAEVPQGSGPDYAKNKASIDVKEDVSALLRGTNLSEEFRSKATTIFEAAVAKCVKEEKEKILSSAKKKIVEAKENNYKKLASRLNKYLDYVAEEFVKENQLAIESGIRTEITENFISGLKELFAKSYIEVPEKKVDLIEKLGRKVEKLEASLNESLNKEVALRNQIKAIRKAEAIRSLGRDLSDTEMDRLRSLAESVDYSDEKDFLEKASLLKETYFPKGKKGTSVVIKEEEDGTLPVGIDGNDVDPNVRVYMDTLAKTIKPRV